MNETLLAEMLALPDPASGHGEAVYELFAWLRGLSFVDVRKGGLFPHDLARDALAADLKWRNPDWYAELHLRARTYYTRLLSHTSGERQQRALVDLVFLHRDNPAVRPFFEWQLSGGAVADGLSEGDVPQILTLVEQFEGAAAARLAGHWLAAQPRGVHVGATRPTTKRAPTPCWAF